MDVQVLTHQVLVQVVGVCLSEVLRRVLEARDEQSLGLVSFVLVGVY